jgi:ribosome-associated protein
MRVSTTSTFRINSRIAIPRDELRFSFVRSSGPGGQNVNKVASKAVLRWSVGRSKAIPPSVRDEFLSRFARRINERGELVLASQRYRDQSKNINDCLARLRALILTVATPRRPRKKTVLPKAARESRLHDKRARAEKKRRRRVPPSDL